jgi:phage baseplate assembly protein gpV
MMGGDLERLILGVVARYMAGRYHEKHALVTSYDPKKHLAKVTFQPSGQESGWLPVEVNAVGESYGILMGLQPGGGGALPPSAAGGDPSQNQGDQVIVRFQEGDFESGKIVQRVHSDQDKPPEVASGEVMIYTKFQKSGGPSPDAADGGQGGTGQRAYFKKDGSIEITDGNGATWTLDGAGNIKLKCKNLEVDAAESIKMKAGGNIIAHATADLGLKSNGVLVVRGSLVGVNADGKVVVKADGDVSDTSVTPPASAPPIPPFEVP